jgi:ABC-2 type transport system permease protein
VLNGLSWPTSIGAWLAFGLGLWLAVVVSFGWRFLLNVSAFWTTDARGLGTIALTASLFLGGFVVPIRYFPDWSQPLVLALPFASYVQTPADLFVGRIQGADILGALLFQVVWAIVLLAAAHLVTLLAIRRVVIQGG